VGVIHALEESLRKAVLTANHVILWKALRPVGMTSKVSQYGRVFIKGGPTGWMGCRREFKSAQRVSSYAL